MDPEPYYVFTTSEDEDVRGGHTTPLLQLFYLHCVWRLAARRVRCWLSVHLAPDYISRYPVTGDDTEKFIVIAPGQPAKMLGDVALVPAEQDENGLTHRPGSLRLRARFEAGRITKTVREQFRTSRERSRWVWWTVVGLLDDRRSGGEGP